MKYFRLLIGMILPVVLLTGCFEIVEEVTLHKDGSGHVELTMNLSKSKSRLNSIMLMDSINNYKVPTKADITSSFEKMVKEISKVKGVSNVSKKMDFNEYIFSVSCNFSNIEVLNQIIAHFSSDQKNIKAANLNQFAYNTNTKTFTRSYEYNFAQEIKKVKAADKKVLEGATITTIYRFPNSVASASNPSSKISGSKTAVMLKVGMEEVIAETKNIKNTIVLN